MRFTALIAATMALAGSTAAQSQCHAGGTANCKPGYDYCAKTLSNRGDADSAIRDALRAAGYSNGKVNSVGAWNDIIYHCNDDYTLKVVKQCDAAYCVDGGLNKNDYCGNSGSALDFF
ncbi:hypothetical protein AtubIFM55763_005821 [Aspergillus tubingensis]|uniref:Killer toxin Kp4 domain-containing protein n=3 Tax=Aspergillus subgen. Circumdati TaxID=2720871 RepID=A0A1L9NE49_ASPTC|nr:uncharacterized protein AtWU_09235 [Aspergillus tubingensis]OJI87535.1 hypothetical protein ASPTUDRAFT_207166 [Aspergillus tubingensis CBS 134.48]GAQ46878.1 hypothetical protein ANI_1_616114 [Aspergillus niger]GFN19431.1 hypothetical protein AtWU_09235 [Aspergillus tubingensis]GLA58920.1 hypothetical protein AtubIFM54640_009648 [Aspergillus tubingensis]GLA74576.1 hypothetical protein AtubIFM55763_005821 [Aspergillus tubingensis]